MKTVWKFGPLQPEHWTVEIEMPAGAEVLHVNVQSRGLDEDAYLWALVDPNAPKGLRRFFLVGTGQPLSEDAGRHVGTWDMMNGRYVWHLFEAP